jgi:hypothetical protein
MDAKLKAKLKENFKKYGFFACDHVFTEEEQKALEKDVEALLIEKQSAIGKHAEGFKQLFARDIENSNHKLLVHKIYRNQEFIQMIRDITGNQKLVPISTNTGNKLAINEISGKLNIYDNGTNMKCHYDTPILKSPGYTFSYTVSSKGGKPLSMETRSEKDPVKSKHVQKLWRGAMSLHSHANADNPTYHCIRRDDHKTTRITYLIQFSESSERLSKAEKTAETMNTLMRMAKTNAEIQKQENKVTFYTIIALVVFTFVLVILLSIILYRKRKSKNKRKR